MNLQEELNLLKERITELEHHAKQEQEFPQDDDEYYVLTGTGSIVEYIWADDSVDSKSQTMGNMFRTEEEAEFTVEKLKVEAELRKYSRPFNFKSSNYSIELLAWVNRLSIDAGSRIQHQGTIYFESEEKAHDAIQTVGECRIKKYIFGVEELNGN